MLYVTTRSNKETYTSARALSEDRAPDGGFFVPLRLPQFDQCEIKELAKKGFSQNVAEIINQFFGTRLDSWSLEFAIGRYPVKIVPISGREVVAETWHNPAWKFERLARGIEKAILQSDRISPKPSDWLMVASRIAVLFGIFGELFKDSIEMPIDVAVASCDFSGVMAAWYAREMGLPIANILCCCNDNNGPWRLLHKGEIRTDGNPILTDTPRCDRIVPRDLERLIHMVLGGKMAAEFAETCRIGNTYYLDPEHQELLRKGVYVPVTGYRRLESAVTSLCQNYRYFSDPYTALCYSGIMDYRSVTGEGRKVLIISEESPEFSLEFLGKCLGLSPWELKNRMQ